jgi:hypothetical protein
MILEDNTPLHVHNPKKMKRKHGGVVVSEPESKEYKVVLRSSGLWTTLIPFLTGTCNLVYLFIWGHVQFWGLRINRGVITHYKSF